MLKMERFVFNSFQVNTYILWDSETNVAAIVDPGCHSESEKKKISDFCGENSLDVQYLLNTHCHIDHILGNEYVMNRFEPQFWAPEADLPLLENLSTQAKLFGIDTENSTKPDHFFTDSADIKIGDIELKCLFTPGHTPGEFCLFFPSEKKCITGDVLFFESIGRTDLWSGNHDTLLESIKSELFTLPDDTEIFPGHGESSTIGHEKLHNPFLRNLT